MDTIGGVPSIDPDAYEGSGWASGISSLMHLLEPRSHTFTEPFESPDIISAWLGCKATELTGALQSKEREKFGLRRSNNLTVPV